MSCGSSYPAEQTKNYDGLSQQLKRQVDKQFGLLSENLRHPSIDAKKYGGTDNLWQGRVNRDHRFYFQIDGDTYRIITIIPHLK
jgi:mRNA-degrading endonuclease RelE of RelBE toxin-antitoxin system